MRRPIAALAALALACSSLAAPTYAAPKPAPQLKLTVKQTPDPGKPGQAISVRIELEPPAGIGVNKYPGVTLRITGDAGLTLASTEAFVGTKTPIDDPAQFKFKKVDPLELKVTAPAGAKGQRVLEGTLKYFYCVNASGFCAPGTMTVKIPVRIG